MREVEKLSEKGMAKARNEIAAQLQPRREYVRVLRGAVELACIFFNANTDEEGVVAARVKALLKAKGGARAIVSRRCHGALAGTPAVFDLEARPVTPPVKLTEVQLDVLDKLARADGWIELPSHETRTGASLRYKKLAWREGGKYKITKQGLERWKVAGR